jgi:PEP-CTERM motif-containing protein
MKCPVLFSLAVISVTASLFASPVAYEGFDYAAGAPLTGQNGGTGWNNAWTISGAGSTIRSPGLTYTDTNGVSLPVIGNTGSFAAANAGNFRIPSTSPETPGTTLYVSFIGRLDAVNANNYAGLSLFNGGTETLFLGDPNVPTSWGMDPKGGVASTGTTPVNIQEFLVYRIDFLASSAEIRLFENPLLGIEPAITAATAFTTKTAALNWDNVRIQANQTGVIDEVRIGTTYADVAPVPEPASAALLALGLFAIAGRRRQS